MQEKDELKKAIDLAVQGKRKEAVSILVDLEPKIKDPILRLQLIDASLANLNQVTDNAKLIKLAGEAIKICGTLGSYSYQAYFMGRKADLLTFQAGIRHHRAVNLKMTPNWIGFATEVDKKEYETLRSEIESMENESETLLDKAINMADKSGDKKTKAHILMEKGQILSSKYLQHKADCMLHSLYGKLWVKFQLFKYPFFETLFSLKNKNINKLANYVKSFTSSFIESGRLLEEDNDPVASSAYYNLANNLKSAYRFSKARKYLKKARTIALKYADVVMIGKIDEMAKIIAKKNKDLPGDSSHGESDF